jgi:hypothetical protein
MAWRGRGLHLTSGKRSSKKPVLKASAVSSPLYRMHEIHACVVPVSLVSTVLGAYPSLYPRNKDAKPKPVMELLRLGSSNEHLEQAPAKSPQFDLHLPAPLNFD